MNLRYIVQYTFFFFDFKEIFPFFFLHFSHNFFYTCLIHDRGHLRSANKICIKKKHTKYEMLYNLSYCKRRPTSDVI